MGVVNRIGEAEQERLGLLSEEFGEAQQVIGKILRHGLDSTNPDATDGRSNAELLEKEVGDVMAAVDILVACATLDDRAIERHRRAKLEKLQRWLHCGMNLDAVEELLRESKSTEPTDRLAAARHEAAEAHMCDGKNIGVTASGRPYCLHCGWNDPQGKPEWPETRPEPRHADGGE